MLFGKSFEKLINPTFSLEETKTGTRAKLTVLVDDGENPPYESYVSYIINPELFKRFGLMAYAHTPVSYSALEGTLQNRSETTGALHMQVGGVDEDASDR